MREFKASTKKGQELIKMGSRYDGQFLSQIYDSWSQAKQNAYLLNELKPCPSAAYIVPNPNCCYDYTITRNGCCNNGCY